jgi:hypothetical protein
MTDQVFPMEQEAQHTIHDREGVCPTCGYHTVFHFLGEQRWPARLVELTGCPPVTYLYTCDHCKTSVSETDIG